MGDGPLMLKRSGAGRWPPLLQRLVAPAVYSEAYLQALDESFPSGDARCALRKEQLAEIRAIEEDAELVEMLEELRQVAREVEVGEDDFRSRESGTTKRRRLLLHRGHEQ